MRRVVLSFAVICFCGLVTNGADAADPWSHAKVLPKSSQVRLMGDEKRVTDRDAGSIFQIAWPASVAKIDGQWLLIRDEGGYSAPPVVGWVRKQDMLRTNGDGTSSADEPTTYFAKKIQEDPSNPEIPVLYWLRGIYWESQGQGEHEIAIADYCAAIRFACGSQGVAGGAPEPPSLAKVCQICAALGAAANGPNGTNPFRGQSGGIVPADAFLRLGRLLAHRADSKSAADDCFTTAEALFRSQGGGLASPVPAQLYVDWGKGEAAKHDKDKVATEPTDATQARKWFEKAIEVNPHWSEPYYRLGELSLTEGKTQQPAPPPAPLDPGAPASVDGSVGQTPPVLPLKPFDPCAKQKSLMAAIQSFSQAIRLDPLSPEGYRQRGEAIRLLAHEKDCKAAVPNGPSSPPLEGPDSSASPSGVPTLALASPRDNVALLDEAAYSADFACSLESYRQSASLEVLANILADHAQILVDQAASLAKVFGNNPKKKIEVATERESAAQLYDQAADYANDAADFSRSIEDRHRLLQLKKFCLCNKKFLDAKPPQPPCDCATTAPRPDQSAPPTHGSFTPRPGRTNLQDD
jgi:tetratricopeptide (TPR) repeat protein